MHCLPILVCLAIAHRYWAVQKLLQNSWDGGLFLIAESSLRTFARTRTMDDRIDEPAHEEADWGSAVSRRIRAIRRSTASGARNCPVEFRRSSGIPFLSARTESASARKPNSSAFARHSAPRGSD